MREERRKEVNENQPLGVSFHLGDITLGHTDKSEHVYENNAYINCIAPVPGVLLLFLFQTESDYVAPDGL